MNKKSSIDPQEIDKFSKLATQWWDKNGMLKTLHDINPARLEYIQRYIDLPSTRILDVGCGGGILSEAMALNGASVTGLDAECEAIQVASLHAKDRKLMIDYVCEPLESFEAHPFDVITCMEMLEHVQNPEIIIEHCARLLKPGGYLFLSTINRTFKAYASVILAAEYILELLPRQTHEYQKFIKPSELCAMARCYDLNILDISGIAYNPFLRVASITQTIDVNYLMVCQKQI